MNGDRIKAIKKRKPPGKARMPKDGLLFLCQINHAGYTWSPSIMDGTLRLVRRIGPENGTTVQVLPKGAYLAFAQLEPKAEDIRRFANKFGDLLDDTYAEEDHVVSEGGWTAGASLEKWKSAIEDMRVLSDLSEDIKRVRLKKLREIIEWRSDGRGGTFVQYNMPDGGFAIIAHPKHHALRFKRIHRGDLVLPARYALQREVNRRLDAYPARPQLTWTGDTLDSTGGFFQRVYLSPPHLLGAMWLQFAQSLTGNFAMKSCAYCGKQFQVGPGARRTDTITCSDSCKTQKSLYRKSL